MKRKALYIRTTEEFLKKLEKARLKFNDLNQLSLNTSQFVRMLLEYGIDRDDRSSSTDRI